MVDRLAVGRTLRNRACAAATVLTNLIYDMTLDGLASQLYEARWRVELAVPPAAYSERKARYLRLRLPP